MLEQPDLGDKCTSYTDEFYSVHDKLNSVKCNSTKTGVILEKGLLGNIFHNFHIDWLGKKNQVMYISDDMSLAALNDDFLLNFALFSLFGMRSIFPRGKLFRSLL